MIYLAVACGMGESGCCGNGQPGFRKGSEKREGWGVCVVVAVGVSPW